MFSAIRQLPKTFISSRLFCSTATPTARKPLGFTQIRLSGEIITEPKPLRSGKHWFLLRTREDGDHSTVHRVHTKFPGAVAAGRHAYVSGIVQTTRFTNLNDKPRFEPTVKATDMSIIKPGHQDTNFVEAKGLVYSDLFEGIDFSTFRILTTYKSISQEGVLVSQFMPIFVYDAALRELLKKALQRSTIVRIVGQLGHDRELNKEQQRCTGAHIRASNIFVSERRNQVAAQDDGTDDLHDSLPSSDEERKTEQQSGKE